MSYYLVFLQTLFDFLSTGSYNALYSFAMALNYAHQFCLKWFELRMLYEHEIPYYYDIYIEPQLILYLLPEKESLREISKDVIKKLC